MSALIPAILTDSSDKFKELVRKLEPHVKRVHIDIADGIFVPNKTITGYIEMKEMSSTGSQQVESALKFDIHLMVQKPQEIIKEWFVTHADRFLIHAESEVDLSLILDEIHKHDRKVGLVFNPETDGERFDENEFPFANENMICSNEKIKKLGIKFTPLITGLETDYLNHYKKSLQLSDR